MRYCPTIQPATLWRASGIGLFLLVLLCLLGECGHGLEIVNEQENFKLVFPEGEGWTNVTLQERRKGLKGQAIHLLSGTQVTVLVHQNPRDKPLNPNSILVRNAALEQLHNVSKGIFNNAKVVKQSAESIEIDGIPALEVKAEISSDEGLIRWHAVSYSTLDKIYAVSVYSIHKDHDVNTVEDSAKKAFSFIRPPKPAVLSTFSWIGALVIGGIIGLALLILLLRDRYARSK